MAIVFLSLGSNLGNRSANLKTAIEIISAKAGIVLQMSGMYETQAWGYNGNNFLNMVVQMETLLEPLALLKVLKETEREMGRIKTSEGYVDRSIDIDILFYDQTVLNSENLTIPHPQLQNRLFVLVPFVEVAPDFFHPVLQKSMKELLDSCPDKGWINHFTV